MSVRKPHGRYKVSQKGSKTGGFKRKKNVELVGLDHVIDE